MVYRASVRGHEFSSQHQHQQFTTAYKSNFRGSNFWPPQALCIWTYGPYTKKQANKYTQLLHALNSSTGETEAGRSEFKASLVYGTISRQPELHRKKSQKKDFLIYICIYVYIKVNGKRKEGVVAFLNQDRRIRRSR